MDSLLPPVPWRVRSPVLCRHHVVVANDVVDFHAVDLISNAARCDNQTHALVYHHHKRLMMGQKRQREVGIQRSSFWQGAKQSRHGDRSCRGPATSAFRFRKGIVGVEEKSEIRGTEVRSQNGKFVFARTRKPTRETRVLPSLLAITR